MTTVQRIQQQLEQMPSDMLLEIESFIQRLRQDSPSHSESTLLQDLAAMAAHDDLPNDLAAQHDHYLYGTQKECVG